MPNYTVTRTYKQDSATLGIMTDDINMEICKTLELPWFNNQIGVSCIPEGTYRYISHFSPEMKRQVLLLFDTEPRADVEIHVGNTVLDIRGCTVVGSRYGILTIRGVDYPAVLDSEPTLDKLLLDAGQAGTITFTSISTGA